MVFKTNIKARIKRHSRIIKDSLSYGSTLSPYYNYSYNLVLFFVIFLIPIYPVLASFVHSNTVIDFYRGEIDESSIIDSYTDQSDTGDAPTDIIVQNKDSYLSINTLLDDERDVTGENDIIEYKVEEGDSISSIAYKFHVSNNSIYWANGFGKNSTIQPGDVLKVPPVSGMIHRVKSGDTLGTLAEKYGISEDKIIAQNGIEDGILVKDSVIVIPGAIKQAEIDTDDGKKILADNTSPKKDTSKNTKNTKNTSTKKGGKSTYSSENGSYSIGKTGSAKGFAWGNCTYFVAAHKKSVNWRGNANQWLSNAAAKGHATGSKASVGAIIVFSGRGYNPRYGHVGIVTGIKGDNVIVTDMNYRALNEVTVRKVPIDDRSIRGYIYVD